MLSTMKVRLLLRSGRIPPRTPNPFNPGCGPDRPSRLIVVVDGLVVFESGNQGEAFAHLDAIGNGAVFGLLGKERNPC